jgi:aconitate hydratase
MGILPLEFEAGQNAESLGLTGEETYDFPGVSELLDAKKSIGKMQASIAGISARVALGRTGGDLPLEIKARANLTVRATASDNTTKQFNAKVRIDTPQEIEYFEHGGILQYVLRQLAAK